MNVALEARLRRYQLIFLVIGLVALALSAWGAFVDRRQFFFSYLFGWLFWIGLSLGCFMMTMIHLLTGGRWGYPTRRFLEAGFSVLPLMLVLVVPIFLGLHELYPWARPEEVAHEASLQKTHPYNNEFAYILRVVIYLVVWIWMGWCLRRWSLQQDSTTNAEPTIKARRLSGPGIVIYSLLGTFAYVDWVMSLEKHWWSTMFGVIVIIGQMLVALAFSVVMLTLFKDEEPLVGVVNRTHYHHLGNLLLTFVLFWTYVSFGQLLIIYSGDIPEELSWYMHRIANKWKIIIGAVAFFHFFLPFLLLLFRTVKRHVVSLTALSAVLFIVHIVDTYWMVLPTLHQHGVVVSWLDFTAPIGIGGLWLAFFLSRLRAAPMLPQQDPGMQFAFIYGHGT